ncbi:hypothetical protein [Flavivirga spongiicola]|uniref:Uncharacterized protein n=1 Tax=Flavivirga spongiicola TaxID=421621 RepID=A0ABU7XUZ7_9FLAO|nr:hypothetical protein [Flavivirga sp. MEBiC05379]MDO5979599.1 hypothetical protein [Flavivirga sp. MEBiC05379]
MYKLNATYFWVKTINFLFVFIISILANDEINAQSKTQENILNIYINNHTKENIKVKPATYVDSALNNPNDIDKKWRTEIAIPLAPFKTSFSQKKALKDDFWPMNFSRVHWEFQLEKGKYQRKTNYVRYS